MIDKLKYYDGDLELIDEIDPKLKEKYKTCF